VGEADSFAALRNDSQKNKGNGNGEKQIPGGNDRKKSEGDPNKKTGAVVTAPVFFLRWSYMSSSMKDLATGAGMRLDWWTSGPGFRTGSSSVRVGTSVRS